MGYEPTAGLGDVDGITGGYADGYESDPGTAGAGAALGYGAVTVVAVGPGSGITTTGEPDVAVGGGPIGAAADAA
jgi:hypothetical protein